MQNMGGVDNIEHGKGSWAGTLWVSTLDHAQDSFGAFTTDLGLQLCRPAGAQPHSPQAAAHDQARFLDPADPDCAHARRHACRAWYMGCLVRQLSALQTS